MSIKCIIHCSDSPHGRGTDAKEIHRWHKDDNGWDGIGYHFVILEDGTIENGRPIYWRGSHARGHNNSVGICLIGIDSFTDSQFSSLRELIDTLGFDKDEIVGHYNISDKTCPNFNVEEFLTNMI